MSTELAPANFGDLEGVDLRARVLELEAAMLAVPDQVSIEPKHYFAPGLYAREVMVPKDTLAVGKIHRTEHISVISKGDVSILTEHGVIRVQAPYTLIAKPGTKRAVYAHEDTVWTTFHPSEETDLVKLEEKIIAPSYAALLQEEPRKQLGGI